MMNGAGNFNSSNWQSFSGPPAGPPPSKFHPMMSMGMGGMRRLERISLCRRLNEVMNEYIALNQDIKKMKKKQKQIKKLEEKRKSEGIDNDSFIRR